jgi:hypothetical protein
MDREDRESIDAITLVQKIFPILVCGKGIFSDENSLKFNKG